MNSKDPVLKDAQYMACDLLVGMFAGYTTRQMEEIIIDALAKAWISATVSTVDVVSENIVKDAIAKL